MAVLLVVLASHVPLVTLHFRRLWEADHFRFFPFVLLAVGCLLWTRFGDGQSIGLHRVGRQLVRAAEVRAVYLGSSLVLLCVAVLLYSPWWAAVSLIVLSLGLLRQMTRFRNGESVVPIWLLLWLLIPLPVRWDEQLIFWMQTASSQAGSRLLDFLGYDHLLSGHTFRVPGHQFLVEQACSGVRSLFALVSLAAIAAVCARRSMIHALPFIASAAFWAFLINVFRVTAVVVCHLQFGVDVSSGWPHSLLGVGLFLVAAWMLFGTDRLLLCLLAPVPVEDDLVEAEEASPRETPVPLPTPSPDRRGVLSGWSFAFGVCFAAIGLIQTLSLAKGDLSANLGEQFRLESCLAEDSLPQSLLGYQREAFTTETRDLERRSDHHSLVWTYQGDGGRLVVSLDFPFFGWHELTDCYRAQGWDVDSRRIRMIHSQLDGQPTPIVTAALRNASGMHGWLFVTHFDREGQPVAPLAAGFTIPSLCTAVRDRVTRRLNGLGFGGPTFQVQILVTRPARYLSDDVPSSESLEAFLGVRDDILETLRRCESWRS